MPVLDPTLAALASQQDGLLARPQLLQAGWSDGRVRAAARSWHAVLPGIYLTSGATVDRDVRARAALLRWPGTALSHDTAARWRGWPVLDQLPKWPGLLNDEPAYDPELVHLTSPAKLTLPDGYVLHRSTAGPTVYVRAGRLTDEVRTAIDVARTAPLPVAVPVLDAVCRVDESVQPEMTAQLGALVGHHGVTQAHRALALVSAAAESVLESLLRLLVRLAGFPPPQVQLPIRLRGTTYRADLAYPEHRLVLEADGRDYHSSWTAVSTDMARQNALVGAGWRVLRFTWRQVLYQPEVVLRSIRAALRS